MLRVWAWGARLCVLVGCVWAVVAVSGAAAQAGSTSEASVSHESVGVRRELAATFQRTGPFVGPATPAGETRSLPAGAKLIEGDTTADSDTWTLPDGHHLTRVFANPINHQVAGGSWQPMSAAERASAKQDTAAQPASGVVPDTEERPLGQQPEAACTISSSEPTHAACGGSISAGHTSSPASTKRSLIKFVMPYDSEELTILSARLELDIASSTSKEAQAMGVYRVITPWTTSATWDTSNGSSAWKTRGGDFAENSEAAINPSVGSTTGWVYWNPTEMLQRWFNGTGAPTGQSDADLGFLVKDVNESSANNLVTFNDSAYENEPSLSYESAPRGVGTGSQYTLLSTNLTPTSTMSVNVASGDLMLRSTDLVIPGRGLSFSSERFFNSLSASPYGYGESWGDSNSSHVQVEGEGSLAYTDSSGGVFAFLKSGSNFITPAGIDATMCAAGSAAPCPTELPSGVIYRIIFEPSQVHVDFGRKGPGGEGYFPTVVEDRYGNKLAASYSSGMEDPSKWTDSEGRKIEYTQTEPYEGYTKIEDVSGKRSVSFKYETIEEWKELVKATDAAGKTTAYGYGPALEADWVRKITDPDGHVTLLEYGEGGRIAKIIRTTNSEHTTGPTTTFAYYEVGKAPEFDKKTGLCTATQKATVVTDPKGNKTLYCTNSLDEVEKTFDAQGNETSTKYNALGNLSSTTAAAPGTGESGAVESLNYDETNRNLLCVIESAGAESSCPTKSPSTSSLVTSFSYKDQNNPYSATQVENPEGNSKFACFNKSKMEYKSKEEEEQYDCPAESSSEPANVLQSESDQLPTQRQLKFTYESNGAVKSSADADGHTTEYAYDSKGNLKEIKPPVPLAATTIEVDADSRPHVIKDGAGHVETITYDSDNRITKIEYTGSGTARTVKFEYDPDGFLVKREDPTGTTKYTIDQLDRITKEELPGSLKNEYGYDEASNMTSFIDGGGTTKYKYNNLNELESMLEPGASTETRFAYNNDHRLTKITYPSGAIENYKLEPATGRPETITAEGVTGTTVPTLTYSYKQGEDDTGLIQKLTESTGNSTTYAYNKLEQLIEATTKGTTIKSHYAYTLDGAGNRLSQQASTTAETGGTTTYFTNNAANELECRQTVSGACNTSDELSAYSDDAAGEETEIAPKSETGGAAFAYDAASQLSSLTPSGGSALALSYGGTGQDDLTAVGASVTLQNSLLGLTREVNSSGTSYFARTPNGLLIDERTPSGNYNPLYDAQGDVIALVNTSKKVERTFHYGPYGENIKSEGTQTIPYPFGYKGGYRMPAGNTGLGNVPNNLIHYGERYYDPTTGRWTQQDPEDRFSSATQGNRFLFAGADPVNASDPSGRSVEDYAKDCATGAISGAADGVQGAVIGCGVSVGIRGAAELLSESGEEEEEDLEQGELIDTVFG